MALLSKTSLLPKVSRATEFFWQFPSDFPSNPFAGQSSWLGVSLWLLWYGGNSSSS
jgi:hypothetical protein